MTFIGLATFLELTSNRSAISVAGIRRRVISTISSTSIRFERPLVASDPVRLVATEASVITVEDNDQVGECAAHLLGDMRFTVRRAANSREAITLFERQHGSIHIVFLDVIMPGIDGVEH